MGNIIFARQTLPVAFPPGAAAIKIAHSDPRTTVTGPFSGVEVLFRVVQRVPVGQLTQHDSGLQAD